MQNSKNNYNEYLIVKCLRESDEAAFEFLFKEYYEPLCLYLRYFIKQNDVVEQIVQEVFVNIWEVQGKKLWLLLQRKYKIIFIQSGKKQGVKLRKT